MRAVFTVEFEPSQDHAYPTDAEFLQRIRAQGWEEITTKDMPDEERRAVYRQRAEALWEEMPEAPEDEKAFVIFYGMLFDNRTPFIVTRMTDSEVTIRLIHAKLGRLQQSTTRVIHALVRPHEGSKGYRISQHRIVIYGRGFQEILIVGRVIPSVLRELWRVDKKDVLLASISLMVAIPLLIGLFYVNSRNHLILGGTMERLSTAFLTSFVVSCIGLLQNLIEIRNEKLIDWKVASNMNAFQM